MPEERLTTCLLGHANTKDPEETLWQGLTLNILKLTIHLQNDKSGVID